MKTALLSIVGAAALGGSLVVDVSDYDAGDDAGRWAEVLGPSRAEWPEPLDELVWRDDLAQALEEARALRRPLFVTARCLPCKQCAEFDKGVLEGGPALTPLLRQFVTVRLTDAGALDLRIFDLERMQDLDLSWWGYFLDSDARVYGVFGGRDHVSDATRISVAALENALRRVLDHHYDPRRSDWGIDPAAPELGGSFRSPEDLPGFAAWERDVSVEERGGAECLHCHQVADILRKPAVDAGTFDKQSGFDVWPLPENAGMSVDRDDGLRVVSVVPESPAAKAGLASGDVIGAAEGIRLFGQADLRAVLHRSADPSGAIELVWTRSGEVHTGVLELEAGWRATELAWRMSVSQGIVGAAPGIPWLHAGPRDGLAPDAMSMRPWFGGHKDRSPAYRAGLRPHHRILAVGGERPNVHGRSFLVWFRRRYEPGDRVKLTVEENGEGREIEYELPER